MRLPDLLLQRKAWLASLFVSTLALLGGCSSETLGKQLSPYRYKLTAQVETPEGVKSGASVIEVQWKLPPKIMGSQGSGSYQVKGQAVAVDLPGGQTLFVLLRSGWNVDWAAKSPYGPHQDLPIGTGDQGPHAVEKTIRTLGRQVSGYPFFVRFRDVGNPHTVEEVDPDNLAATFGPGVRLKALTVQLTGEPVTLGIRDRLPWLNDTSRGLFKAKVDPATGRRISSPITSINQELTYQDFVRPSAPPSRPR